MTPLFVRPDPVHVAKLWSARIRLVAPALDHLWDGKKRMHVRAFAPNHPSQSHLPQILPDGELTWWPRYPKDWIDHPQVWRAMEFIYYDVRQRGRGLDLLIQQKGPGVYFLRVHPSWKMPLINGTRSLADLRKVLWNGRKGDMT